MTINSPAAVLWAMYLAVAEQQGVDWSRLSGTLQNDILKEYIAQKEYIFPPRPSMRLVTDTIEFGARHTPRFNPISISGYHIREAGSTAVQELAFTLRDGMEYVDWALERGLAIDDFAPRLSFFFNAHSDFFEEIAKYRAARKIWAHVMRDRYGAQERAQHEAALPRADGGLLAHLAAAVQQRGADGAAGDVRGAGRRAVAAHQFARRGLCAAQRACGDHRAAHAAGDGVRERRGEYAGSPGRQLFRGEADARSEAAANDYIRRIDEMGGMIAAIEAGFPQSEIAAASYRYQREVEAGERVHRGGEPRSSPTTSPSSCCRSTRRPAQHQEAETGGAARAARQCTRSRETLDALKRAAEGTENTMPLPAGCRSGLRDAGRDLRCAAGSFRHVSGDDTHL